MDSLKEHLLKAEKLYHLYHQTMQLNVKYKYQEAGFEALDKQTTLNWVKFSELVTINEK